MKGKWCTASLIMNILKTVLPNIMFDLAEHFGTIFMISCPVLVPRAMLLA